MSDGRKARRTSSGGSSRRRRSGVGSSLGRGGYFPRKPVSSETSEGKEERGRTGGSGVGGSLGSSENLSLLGLCIHNAMP